MSKWVWLILAVSFGLMTIYSLHNSIFAVIYGSGTVVCLFVLILAAKYH